MEKGVSCSQACIACHIGSSIVCMSSTWHILSVALCLRYRMYNRVKCDELIYSCIKISNTASRGVHLIN